MKPCKMYLKTYFLNKNNSEKHLNLCNFYQNYMVTKHHTYLPKEDLKQNYTKNILQAKHYFQAYANMLLKKIVKKL